MLTRIAVALLCTLTARAATQPAAAIRDTCKGFEVRLQSASGDAMEDDMAVSLVFGDKEVEVQLSPALFTPRHPLQNVTNLCSQLTAVDAGNDRVLLLLSRNSRPQFDRLDAVLLDLARQRVLDLRPDLGEIKTDSDILVVRSGGKAAFDVLLIRESIDNSGCDCAEAAIEDWMRLTITKDKIQARWTRAIQ